MSLYLYQCNMCGAEYEIEHDPQDDVAVVCWHCTNDVICKRKNLKDPIQHTIDCIEAARAAAEAAGGPIQVPVIKAEVDDAR